MTDLFTVLGTVAGLPIRRQRDFGGLSLALDIFAGLEDVDRDDHPKGLQRDVATLAAGFKSEGGNLLKLAEFVSDLQNDDAIGPAGRALACRILAGPQYLNGFLLSVSEGLKGAPGYRSISEPSDRAVHVLRRFARAADTSRAALSAFQQERDLWLTKTAYTAERDASGQIVYGQKRRSNSKLPRLVDLMLTINVLTASQVARLLGISPRGATDLLKELADLDLVVEVTHRSNWRAHVSREFAKGNLDALSPQKRSRSGRRLAAAARLEVAALAGMTAKAPSPTSEQDAKTPVIEVDEEAENVVVDGDIEDLVRSINDAIARSTKVLDR